MSPVAMIADQDGEESRDGPFRRFDDEALWKTAKIPLRILQIFRKFGQKRSARTRKTYDELAASY
jgi:hypothetical protein